MSKRKPLTEEKWLAETSSDSLLVYLQQHCRITKVPGGKRKLRLFSVACCRAVWQLFTNEDCRRAVEVGERAADSQATRAEVIRAAEAANVLALTAQERMRASIRREDAGSPIQVEATRDQSMGHAGHYTATQQVGIRGAQIVLGSATILRCWEPGVYDEAWYAKQLHEADRFHAELVRDIFGNPFRSVSIEPRWLTATVVDLSRIIYADRAFERMPILADALMDAGCDSDDIIAHCRGDGPHFRGCWVVDALLGR